MTLLKNIYEKLIITIRNIKGIPPVKPGDNVDIRGTGERYNSDAYVESTTHAAGSEEYENNIETSKENNLTD